MPKGSQLSNSEVAVGGVTVTYDGLLTITIPKADGTVGGGSGYDITSECLDDGGGRSLIAKQFEWDAPYVTAVLRTPTQAASKCYLHCPLCCTYCILEFRRLHTYFFG